MDGQVFYVLGQRECLPEDILEPTRIFMNALEQEWQRLRPMTDRAADARAQLAEHSAAHGRHTAEVTSLQTSSAAANARQDLALEAKKKVPAELAEFEAALRRKRLRPKCTAKRRRSCTRNARRTRRLLAP